MKKNVLNTIIDLALDTFKSFKRLIDAILELLKNPVVMRLSDEALGSLNKFWHFILNSYEFIKERARKKKSIEILFQTLQMLFILFILLLLSTSTVLFQVGNRWDKKSYIVNIPKGYGAGEVANLLWQRGIIDGKYGFNLLLNFYNLEKKLQAGTYEFSPNMSLIKIVLKLKSGEVIPPPLMRIVFPEGSSIYKMATLMEKEGIGEAEAMRKLVKNPITESLLEKYSFLGGVKGDSLEGYLFPDTYLVPSNIRTDLLADIMLSRFRAQVIPFWKKARYNTRFSLHQIITLASIIEKEAAVERERPIISSVFYNRLKKRMHLAADPTVKYALSEIRRPTKKVYWIDLAVDSPYNTYKYLGLPPGPICNPGLSSIKAAIYPAKTDYLYFVAKKDGAHIFSKTWQEHEEARKLVKK